MNISQHWVWKIIVDDQIHIPKIYASSDDISGYKHPVSSSIKLIDYPLPFLFWLITGQDLDSPTLLQLLFEIFFEFEVQLFSSLFLLNEQQHRRR